MEANLPRFGPDADLHSLGQEDVLAHFDACMAAGVIKFDQDFITKMHTINGIEVCLLCNDLSTGFPD